MEVFAIEGFGEIAGGVVDQMPSQVRLPIGDWHRGEHLVDAREKLRLADDHIIHAFDIDRFEIRLPFYSGCEDGQFIDGFFVVLRLVVAQCHRRAGCLGQRGFDPQHRIRTGGGSIRSVAQE